MVEKMKKWQKAVQGKHKLCFLHKNAVQIRANATKNGRDAENELILRKEHDKICLYT